MNKIITTAVLALTATVAMAQAPRTAYHMDGFVYGHQLNPAFQPDSDYFSLPLLGGTNISLGTTMKMSDIFYDLPNGKLTTCLTKGTISKSDLLDKVGDGLQTSLDTRLTLISIGKRINAQRYRTMEASFRTQVDAYLPKELFSMIKDVENGSYDISNLDIRATSFLDLSYGESYRMNDRLTVGGKAKLLVGILNADVAVDNMTVNVESGSNWTAQGNITANVSGLEYKTEAKEYKSRYNADGTLKTYPSVKSVKAGSIGLNGLGLAIDAGAEFKYDENLSFSIGLRDLGFITWFKSNKAENSGEKFEFDGFQNISAEKSDYNSLSNQADRLTDDLMDMAHLEEKGSSSNTQMLGCTVEASAKYKYDVYTAGALFTSRVQGRYTWLEARLNLGATLPKGFDVVLSPAVNTFGTCLGAMVNYRHNGFNVYLGSDRLFSQVNKQMIPTSLNAALQFGMTFAL